MPLDNVDKLISSEMQIYEQMINDAYRQRKRGNYTREMSAGHHKMNEKFLKYVFSKIDQAKKHNPAFILKDILLEFEPRPTRPNEVLTDNSQLYPEILKIASRKIINGSHFFDQASKMQANHEWEHVVTDLGDPGLKILYGLEFWEDNTGKGSLVRPFVRYSGKTNLENFLIAHEVEKEILSPTDLIDNSYVERIKSKLME